MSVYPYEMIGGHVVIVTVDGALFLDSGAPMSVGPGVLQISGRVFRVLLLSWVRSDHAVQAATVSGNMTSTTISE